MILQETKGIFSYFLCSGAVERKAKNKLVGSEINKGSFISTGGADGAAARARVLTVLFGPKLNCHTLDPYSWPC